jgi:putative PEP-CTERM system TPR-repeat lipoprotein
MALQAKRLTVVTALTVSTLGLGMGLAGCNKQQDPVQLVSEARAYRQKGDLKAALIQAKNAVAADANKAEARLLLGQLYMDSNDPVSAEKELRKALAQGSPAAEVTPLLLEALIGQGAFEKVVEEAAKAPPSALIHSLHGDALLALQKPEEARAAYQAALQLEPQHAGGQLGLVRLSALKGDLAGALAEVDKILAAQPKVVDAHTLKGMLLRASGKPEGAIAAYREALALRPNQAPAQLELAHLHMQAGQFKEARAAVDAARKLAPNLLLVAYTEAMLQFSEKNLQGARETTQKILRAVPDHGPTLLLAGAVEQALGANQQAHQHLVKYVQANPNHVGARKLLAEVQLKQGAPADALDNLSRVQQQAQRDPQFLALLAQAELQQGDFKKATELFEKAASIVPEAASLRTALGITRMSAGDTERAIAEMEAAAKLDSKSIQAGMTLALAELKLKHYDKALAAATKLEQSHPDNAQVHNLKGGIYAGKGELAAARAAFAKALQLQPSHVGAAINLAQLELRAGKQDEALKPLRTLLEKDPSNVGALLALGDLLAAQKKTAEATAQFEKAVSAAPTQSLPARRLAEHLLQGGEADKAQGVVRKALVANSSDPALLDMQGRLQAQAKDYGGALETYSKLASSTPDSPVALMRMAMVQRLMNNEAGALETLRKAAAVAPNNPEVQVMLGEQLARGGQLQPALAVAAQLQKSHPKLTAGFALEGSLLLASDKAEAAVKPFERALAVNPDSSLMANQLLTALQRAGRQKDAEARAAQWLKQHPNDDLVHLHVAETHLAAKRYADAAKVLEGSAQRQPNNMVVLNNLAWSYFELNDPRALATAEKALAVGGDNPAVLDTLGWILANKGDAKRAVALLRKAVAGAPNAPGIRYHLAVALGKAGDNKGAKAELETALKGGQFAEQDQARALLRQL